MANAEKAMSEMGVSIRDGENGLRNINDVLSDVAGKWGSLGDQEKQEYAEALAGTRQKAVFISMMESQTTQQNLYNDALNSTGALQNANDIKAQSIQGKLNTLKTTLNQMWSGMISSNFVKGIVDGTTKIVSAMQNIPLVISGIVTAFAILKSEAITDLLDVVAGESALSFVS